MFATEVAHRLRRFRKDRGLRQEHVARALGLSVSAISRLERGIRGLRVEQLVAWAGSLGYRVELLFWKPVLPSEEWASEDADTAPVLDDECVTLLSDVASALPHMPGPARRALAHEMQVWREEALRQYEADASAGFRDRPSLVG
jgi:transcriptional regulator with XRE-family HTH domain